VIVAVAVELLVAVVAFVPTWRGARRSTMDVLEGARAGGKASRLARTAARLRLPVPVVVGAKDTFAQRGRALLTGSTLVLSVIVLVAALSMEASFVLEDAQTREFLEQIEGEPTPGVIGPRWDVFEDQSSERAQLRLIVYGLDAVLLAVALANLLTTALLVVRERVRDLGILKAVGLTPRDVRLSVVSSHGLLGVLAALVGIPLGVGVFLLVYRLVNGTTEDAAVPPWWQLGLLFPGVVLLVALGCWVPARLAARLPVVDALRYE
jgi:predicted lysophospholipase L1 biosynthesis ABC-type transport system permease subunit